MGVTTMNNKEKMKMSIEKDINSNNYYNEIIDQIEKKKTKFFLWKCVLAPICLVIICSGVFLSTEKGALKDLPESSSSTEDNITLNINDMSDKKSEISIIDDDVKIATDNTDNFYMPYNNQLSIPADLTKKEQYIYYFKENKTSKEYNKLGYYEIKYSSIQERTIKIKYSEYYKLTKDYFFSNEDSKTTKINGTELKIYKVNNIYFAEFRLNEYNFDIESTNITEQELLTFLLSILK